MLTDNLLSWPITSDSRQVIEGYRKYFDDLRLSIDNLGLSNDKPDLSRNFDILGFSIDNFGLSKITLII